MSSGLAFELGRVRATGRIAADYLHSILRPTVRGAEAWPVDAAGQRGGESLDPLPERFRLLSWNIHRGYLLEEVRASLEGILTGSSAPHVLLLQEVPMFPGRPFWECDGLRQLLASWHLCFAPMHQVLRPSPYYPFLASGQLTASRAPVVAMEVVPLPRVSRPKLGRRHRVQRLALGSTVPTLRGDATVWNVHLENTTGPAGRGRQTRCLVARIDDGPSGPTILGGDFNTLFGPLEKAPGVLAEAGFERASVAQRRPLRPAIDHVFVRGLSARSGLELGSRGSDHRPLVVEVEVSRVVSNAPWIDDVEGGARDPSGRSPHSSSR